MNFTLFSLFLIKFIFISVECIQQGDFIPITEAPYFASLINSVSNSKCGAAILSEYWIVSAGHCFDHWQYKEYKVRTGASLKKGIGSVHSVDQIVLHNNYTRAIDEVLLGSYPINDISLVKLKEPIEFNEYQKPVEIRSSLPKVNDTVIIVGLGFERVEKRPPSLKKTLLSVAATGPPFFFNPATVFHLQNSTSHLCPGDSGSPGIIDGKLAGVVSIGDERCKDWDSSHENRYPGALTRIDLYCNWILNQTGLTY